MKPSAVARALVHVLDKGRVPFLWGAPGVGKSSVVAQVCKEQGWELRDVRLSQMDPVDLRGFPVPDLAKGIMHWLPANFLPTAQKKGSKGGIIFLDEMNSAPPATQAVGYQFVLDRRIGEYVLPNNWHIVAAGNRETDRSVVNKMPAALRNRLIHIDFDLNNEDWQIWASEIDPATKKERVISEVRAFLRWKTNLLHNFDGATNPRAFPTPRSWEFVSDIAKSNLPRDEELELIKGTVGEGAAGEFIAYLRVWRDLPTIESILLNPDKAPVPTEPSQLYALATTLEDKANRGNFDKLMKYVARMPTEFQVVFVRGAARRHDDVTETKSFVDWSVKHSDVLL
jgi:hypothetical protein